MSPETLYADHPGNLLIGLKKGKIFSEQAIQRTANTRHDLLCFSVT
jgi:hypothetical protein